VRKQKSEFCMAVACTILIILTTWVLTGCGGSGGPALLPHDGDANGGDVSSAETSTAHFLVDVATGEVTVTHTDATAGAVESAAAFSGTAVHFDSTVLHDQPGDTGLKVLDVTLTNRTGFAIGQSPDGTETGVHVLFGDIVPVASASDIRHEVHVSTLATLPQLPSGVAVAADGSLYVTALHQVFKVSNGVVSVLAGDTLSGYAGGVGTSARFTYPFGIAVNPVDGALIVAELYGHHIRRIDETGSTSLVAGTGTVGGKDGSGNEARFNGPAGVTVDSSGVIYVTESAGHRIRKIEYTGTDPAQSSSYTVSTYAGSGIAGFADGRGGAARFNNPWGVTIDENGNLYVADGNNYRIRVVLPGGRVSTIAGNGTAGTADGDGDVATFARPYGVAVLPDRGRGSAVIVTDTTAHTLRQLRLKGDGTASPGSAANWTVQTLAGQAGVSGAADGPGNAARFNYPRVLSSDASGTLYVPDNGTSSLRCVAPNEGFFPVGTPDGGATTENVQLSNADGWLPYCGGSNRPFVAYPAVGRGATSAAQTWAFSVPEGVTAFEFTVIVSAQTETPAPPQGVDGDTNGGKGSSRVLVHTLAGSTTGVNGFIDGMGANARFRCIIGISCDFAGNAYLADAENDAVRMVTPEGRVSTIAGSRGAAGYTNGRGNVAELNYPSDLAVAEGDFLSSAGGWPPGTDGVHVLVADLDNDRIRIVRGPYTGWTAITPWEPWNAGFYQVSTVAGDGTSAYSNGRGDAAQFGAPGSIAMGPGGIFYVLERSGGNRVRTLRWTGGDPMSAQNWEVSLLAGSTTGDSGYVNATGSSARFYDPRGIAVGPDGMVYVADTYNDCIRKITPDGVVSTLAGTNINGYVDATGSSARFYRPWSLDVGSDGYIYVADRYNYRIRRVSPAGVVTTVAGTGSTTRDDGRGDVSGHQDDLGIAVGPSGDLYIGEAECLRVIERIIDVGDFGVGDS